MAPEKPQTTWIGATGAAAFDLRSDTMTTPTSSMLATIQTCSLLDDVMMEDRTTMELEDLVADLTGKEAGLLVLSGTMGNQIGLRTLLTQPPHSVLCDYRSHIYQYEAGGVSSLTGAMVKVVRPSNGMYLTLDDVESNISLVRDVHYCPTKVISLENTINGVIMPLTEVQKISIFARKHGIKMHCDGARLWEAVAAGAGSLKDFSDCFDSVTLCFSKGLGAPIGSILVGERAFIDHARWVRKSIGGGLRQAGVISAPACVAVQETFLDGQLAKSHETARKAARMWTDLGGKLDLPVDTNMLWLDLAGLGCSTEQFEEAAAAYGLRVMGNRVVCHYQVGEEALARLHKVFKRLVQETASRRAQGATSHRGSPGVGRSGPYAARL